MVSANTLHDAAYLSVVKDRLKGIEDAEEKRQFWEYIVMAVIAALKAAAADNAKDIADWQLDMADDIADHWEAFLPEEKKLLDEVFAIPKAVPQYQIGEQYEGLISDTFSTVYEEYAKFVADTCGLSQMSACQEAKWANQEALTEADYGNYGLRVAEQREQIDNDTRYMMRYAALGLVKGVCNTVQGFAAQANLNLNSPVAALARFGSQLFSYKPPSAPVIQPQFVASAPYAIQTASSNQARPPSTSPPSVNPPDIQLPTPEEGLNL